MSAYRQARRYGSGSGAGRSPAHAQPGDSLQLVDQGSPVPTKVTVTTIADSIGTIMVVSVPRPAASIHRHRSRRALRDL